MLGLVPAYLWEQSMPWPEDIASELPEPHPEEPPSLRSDILDELYDHLQSSLEHEQLTEADAVAARKSVLTRFGNPATIACRLWWDAMWGRIMLQRITLGFVALLSCCAIVATFLIWRAIENSHQATAALVAQVQKLAERNEVQAKPGDERLKYLDWIPVTVNLEYESGEPVTDEKYKVTLAGTGLYGTATANSRGTTSTEVTEHPDETGTVDFGLVKPGKMSCMITTPWQEMTRTSIVAKPGSPVELNFVCPRKAAAMVPAKIRIDWPADIRDRNLWVNMMLSIGTRVVADRTWTNTNLQPITLSVFVDPDGNRYRGNLSEYPDTDSSIKSTYGMPLEQLEYLLLGTNEEGIINLDSDMIVDKGGLQPYKRTLSEWLSSRLREELYTTNMQPVHELLLPEHGVTIVNLQILRGVEKRTVGEEKGRAVDATFFGPFLPVCTWYQTQEIGTISSDDWTYRPSDRIVELVRKRLEQIDEEEPGEEGNTEAAEVSADTN